MPTDPFEARRRGLHRLRLVTASIGAAAAVGTGAIAWSAASQTASATAADVSNGTGSTSTGSGFAAPAHPPGSTTSGGAHASSGGS
jgi:hypothetical protein